MTFNPVVDVRYFKHPDGRVIYITYINDKPMIAIPEGFTQTDKPVEQQVGKAADEKTTEATAAAAAQNDEVIRLRGGNSDSAATGGSQSGGRTPSISDEGVVTAANTGLTNNQARGIGTVFGTLAGIPGLGLVMGWANEKANKGYAKDAEDVSRGIKSGDEMGIPGGATAGATGTGGAAAAAGTAAASAASAAGYGAEAVAAAAQAAANAAVSGATPSQAADYGRAAAATFAGDIDYASISEGVTVDAPPDTGVTTSPVSAPDIDSSTYGPGDFGPGSTSSATGTGNPGEAEAGGFGYAKGGFITKKKKKNVVVKSKRGLASR
jgi:hypothetical protein